MKRLLALLLFSLPLVTAAEDYQSSLLVQTGTLRESDLVVRTVTDLENNKICLSFYVRTTGTSPAMSCYDTRGGYRTDVSQTGHFKKGKLVVRKIKDEYGLHICACLGLLEPDQSQQAQHFQAEPGIEIVLLRQRCAVDRVQEVHWNRVHRKPLQLEDRVQDVVARHAGVGDRHQTG